MTTSQTFRHALVIGTALAATTALSGCSVLSPKAKAPHAQAHHGGHYAQPHAQPRSQPQKGSRGFFSKAKHKHVAPYANLGDRIRGRRKIAYQRPAPLPRPGSFQRWVEGEPGYRLYPGDQVDVVVSSAPELSRTLTVAPDGRVDLPMAGNVMAAGRTLPQLQNILSHALSDQLRDPTVAVTARAFTPQQVFVGGQVGQPGTYTLPGPVGAIETVFMAGGWQPGARAKEIAVLRRAPNGGMMMRVVNLSGGLANIREYDDNLQLRRGDIVFVPRNTLAEIGVFMQSVRNALPVDFNVAYQFGAQEGGTTVISP